LWIAADQAATFPCFSFLLHALERAVAMSKGDVIRLAHLPPALGGGQPAEVGPDETIQPLAKALEQFELQYIHRVLARVDGHRGRAAELLGISRKSLWERLRDEPEPEK
jgi:transcriptional regulator with PAS, ATPase and Fis domain